MNRSKKTLHDDILYEEYHKDKKNKGTITHGPPMMGDQQRVPLFAELRALLETDPAFQVGYQAVPEWAYALQEPFNSVVNTIVIPTTYVNHKLPPTNVKNYQLLLTKATPPPKTTSTNNNDQQLPTTNNYYQQLPTANNY